MPKASAQFVANMAAIVAVDPRPSEATRPPMCLDAARQALHSTPHGTRPWPPGPPARRDDASQRPGTARLVVWVAPRTGRRQARVPTRQTGVELAEPLRLLADEDDPDAEPRVRVVDHLKTHAPACLYARVAPEDARRMARKLAWHATPEHGSWLKMAECALRVLARQGLSRRLAAVNTLPREGAAWEHRRHQMHVTLDWRFTTADARIRFKRLSPVLKEQKEHKTA